MNMFMHLNGMKKYIGLVRKADCLLCSPTGHVIFAYSNSVKLQIYKGFM